MYCIEQVKEMCKILYPKNTSNIGHITTGGQGEDSSDSEQYPEHDTPSSDDRFDFILYKLLGIL